MLDSSSVFKQPLLDDTTIDSSSLRARAELRRHYKRRVEKSRAAASSSHNNNCDVNIDVEDRQGLSYDQSILSASTSDTEPITTSVTSSERTRERAQSLDEEIIVPIAKTFPPPNNSLDEQPHQQQHQSFKSPRLPPMSQLDRSRGYRGNTMRTPPPPPKSPLSSSDRAIYSASLRPKPKYKRSSTVESAASSNVVDDVLMDRALNIRENLRRAEMEELAVEAERAAESGIEKFVGSASKYVEESPVQTPKYNTERKQIAAPDSFAFSMVTPQKSRGLLELDPLEFTPSSYFSNTKKIKVSALRKFSDVIPNFSDMHSNIRFHLKRGGVDASTLPEVGRREIPSLVKNDTIESDVHSQAPSVTSGSIGSFSSYAASSIKGVVELLGRSRSNTSNKNVPGDFSIIQKSSSAISSFDGEKAMRPLWEQSEEENERVVDKSASEDFLIKAQRSPVPPLFPSVQMARSADFMGNRSIIKSRETPPLVTSKSDANNLTAENYDSDDSSVEMYGRKSPLTLSLEDSVNKQNEQGMVESKALLNRLNLKPALSRSRSNHASPSIDTSQRGASNNNVSFEDPIGFRGCSPEIPLLQKSLTRDSADETGSGAVLSIFDRIQRQFSVSRDDRRDDEQHPMKTEEENKLFVHNYFYTEKCVESTEELNLKLDINPRKDKAFCVVNCAEEDIRFVSSCETLGQFVTSALEWVSSKKSDGTVFSNRTDGASFSNLYTDNGHYREKEKRVFVPPRLSERSTSDNDIRHSNIHHPHGTGVFEQDERIPDCSEIVVCDGFDLNRTNDENFE